MAQYVNGMEMERVQNVQHLGSIMHKDVVCKVRWRRECSWVGKISETLEVLVYDRNTISEVKKT